MLVKTMRFARDPNHISGSGSFYYTNKKQQKQYYELLYLCNRILLNYVKLGEANSFVVKVYTSPGRNRLKLGVSTECDTVTVNHAGWLFGGQMQLYIRDMSSQLRLKYPHKVSNCLYIGFFNDDKTEQFVVCQNHQIA